MTRWPVLLLLGCTPLQSRATRDAATDLAADLGCAADVLSDPAHCGACGLRCASGERCVAGACRVDPDPPRLVSPPSGTTLRTRRPTLRWQPAHGAQEARISLCRDRSMTNDCREFTSRATSGSPREDLLPGDWFWRATSLADGQPSARGSAVWRLRVGTVDTTRGPALDLDSDGQVELVISAPRVGSFAGRVYVYEGIGDPEPAPSGTRRGTVGAELGISLSNAGDVNHDGFTDLVVGAQGANQMWLFLGGANGINGAALRRDGPEDTERYGLLVAGVGDVNGDGYDDVAASARASDGSAGLAHVYLGHAEGVSDAPAFTLRASDVTAIDAYVAAAGDVNGDGYADVALGVSAAEGNIGIVRVFHGGPDGLSETPATTLRGSDILGRFGLRLVAAGDVNGDGYGDLFVGAPEAMERAGRVFLFTGGAGGLDATPRSELVGPAPGAGLGFALAPPADLDGDGFNDLVVGSPGHPVSTGTVSVYRGGVTGLETTPWFSRLGLDGADSAYGHGVLAVDLNQDGRSDLVVGSLSVAGNTGRAYVYLAHADGWSDRPIPITGRDGMQGVFGWSLARAPRRVVDPRGWL